MLLTLYLFGSLVTMAIAVAAYEALDNPIPPRKLTTATLVLASGVIWPVLVIALAQVACISVLTRFPPLRLSYNRSGSVIRQVHPLRK